MKKSANWWLALPKIQRQTNKAVVYNDDQLT